MKNLMVVLMVLSATIPASAREMNPRVAKMLEAAHTDPVIFIGADLGMCYGTFSQVGYTWSFFEGVRLRIWHPFEIRGRMEVFTPDRVFSVGHMARLDIMNVHENESFVLVSQHLQLAWDTHPNRIFSMRVEAFPVGMTHYLRDEGRPRILAELPSSGVGLKFNLKWFVFGPTLFWGWGGTFQVTATVGWSGPI